MPANAVTSDAYMPEGLLTRRKFVEISGCALIAETVFSNFSVAQSAAVCDYYIAANGSDSNPGTITQPWAITALQTKTSSITGKTVGLLDGTYVCNIGQTQTGSNTGGIQWNAPGCTIKAINARQAVITTNNGGVYPQATEPVLQVLGANCTIDGIKFYQSAWDFVRVTGSGTTIKNCHFEDVQLSRYTSYTAQGDNVSAITINDSGAYYPTLVVDNCYFSNMYNGNRSENSCCIGPIYGGGNTTVTRCSFFNSIIGVGWKSYNHGPLNVSNCYFDSTLTKLAVYGGMSNDDYIPMQFTFKNNVVNNVGYGLDVWNINHPHSENISDIEHNTFYFTSKANAYGTGGIAYSADLTGPVLSGAQLHQCVLKDNLFHRDSGTARVLKWQAGRNSSTDLFGTIDYNMYSVFQALDADGVTYSTLASWQVHVGQEAHSIVATPTFVNSTGNTAAGFALAGGNGRNAASDGTDIGAWGGGVSQIGSNFGGGAAPKAPSLSGVT